MPDPYDHDPIRRFGAPEEVHQEVPIRDVSEYHRDFPPYEPPDPAIRMMPADVSFEMHEAARQVLRRRMHDNPTFWDKPAEWREGLVNDLVDAMHAAHVASRPDVPPSFNVPV